MLINIWHNTITGTMSAGKIILSVSPALYKSIKRVKKRVTGLIFPKLSEEDFRELLEGKLGLTKGAVVFIHSSIDNLNIDFPFYRLYYLLLDIVGKEGTLLFPCWHFNYRAEDYLRNNEVFDVNKSLSILGILSEFTRRQKGSFRSLHPTSSVVATGKYAYELTSEHHCSVYPNGPQSPFYKIVKHNGLIIGLGVDTEHLSFVHCVEDIMQGFPYITRTNEVFNGRVITPAGKEIIVPTLAAHSQIKNRNVNRYLRNYIPQDICRNFSFRGVKYFYAYSGPLYLKMEELAGRRITIYDKNNQRTEILEDI
jgi:aminoglycoside N3'-acetyltransferase